MILLIVLSLSVFFILQNISQNKTQLENNSGRKWSCETIRGVSCPSVEKESGSSSHWDMTSHGFDMTIYRKVTCMDTKKTISNTLAAGSALINHWYGGTYNQNISCLNPSTPCIQNFTVCIQDPYYPPVRLDCKYLKGFEQAEDEDEICGANGAIQETYMIDSGFTITKFDFNCVNLHFEKPLPYPDIWKKIEGDSSNESNWSCESMKGGICPKESTMYSSVGLEIPQVVRLYANKTCLNVNKTGFGYTGSHGYSRYKDDMVNIECSDPSFPCLTEFEICIQHYDDETLRLRCKYLGDFEETEHESPSSKCGAKSAKRETYTIETKKYFTKFRFNSRKANAEKQLKTRWKISKMYTAKNIR